MSENHIRSLSELNRATSSNIEEPELTSLVQDLFSYRPWNEEQIAKGAIVKNALAEAYKAIILNVPSGPSRTRALNCLVDARMLANASLSFDGVV